MTVIFPVFRKCWCCLLVGCQVLLGNMCWDYFQCSHQHSAHQSPPWGCFKPVWTTAASQSPPASPGWGEHKHEEAQGGHADHFLRNSCHARLWLSLPKPAAKPGVTFKKSGTELGGTLWIHGEGFLQNDSQEEKLSEMLFSFSLQQGLQQLGCCFTSQQLLPSSSSEFAFCRELLALYKVKYTK